MKFQIVLFSLLLSTLFAQASTAAESSTVTGSFIVGKESTPIRYVYAFHEKCNSDNIDPVGPDTVLLFTDTEVPPEFLLDTFMDEIVAYNHGELMKLANTGKFHGFLISIGKRGLGMSDSLPPVVPHERGQLYHIAFGQNASVGTTGDAKFEGKLEEKKVSGKISSKGNFSGSGIDWSYDVTFSTDAKDLPAAKQ